MGDMKAQRGKTLPLTLSQMALPDDILNEALLKMRRFKNLPADDGGVTYKLLYPDFETEVDTLPGLEEPFTLCRYKEDLGRTYGRISLYLCDQRYLGASKHTGMCV